MNPDELVAREVIRDLIARYAHAVDTGRSARLVELFTPTGVLEVPGEPPVVGHQAIAAFLDRTASALAATGAVGLVRHHVSSVRIDLAGADEALAVSYFAVYSERGVDHWGRYRDRFLRVGEGWRFVHRQVQVDGAAPGSWAAT